MQNLLLALVLSIFSLSSYAGKINVGAKLSTLSVPQGEILLNGKSKTWSNTKSYNKPHVVIYMAGRISSKNMIKPLTSALNKLDKKSFHSTTLVNGDDVTMGASAFALSEMKKNKKIHKHATLVFDADGKGQKIWSLKKGGAAVVVLDSNNKVVYFREGAVSASEAAKVVSLLK